MKTKDEKNKKYCLYFASCHYQIPDVLKRSQYPTNTAVLTREAIRVNIASQC